MLKTSINVFSILVALFICNKVMAQGDIVPAPPTADSRAYILLDHDSGRVLAEKEADQPVEPASLTKMMTTYVVGDELEAGHISLSDKVLVSEKAWRTAGSRMFIEVDTEVTVDDLLKGIIIQSGNDASVAIAEHISGSEDVFAQLMNQTASRLGMKNTHFENSTGIPAEGHVTTARDMAILSRALIRDHPDLYSLHAVKDFTYNDIKQPNRNQLLWRDSSVDGIKTGHTEAAGYCLVVSAQRQDMRLISVVMGTPSVSARTTFSQALLNYGFRFYETHRMAEAKSVLGNARIWKGSEEAIDYGVTDDIFITVPRGRRDQVNMIIEISEPLVAPVTSGDEIGHIVLQLDENKVLSEQSLIAVNSVEQGGIVKRLIDSAKLLLE